MTLQNVQLSVKNNSEELQDYLRDLKHWEEDIKKEDLNLKESRNLNVKEMDCKSRSISDTRQESEIKKMSNSKSQEKLLSHPLPNSHKEKAEKLKEEGNKLYAAGKYSDAVSKYTQGIGLDSSNKLLPANRAMALIKLGKFKAAEKDCNKALTLDSCYIKALLRRATARSMTSNIFGAIEDYEKALELEPWNKSTRKELEKLKLTKEYEASVPPLEDSPLILNKENLAKTEAVKERNELKVTEISETTPKPHGFSSQKSLVKVPVERVSSMERLEELMGGKSSNNEATKTSEFKTVKKEGFEKSPELVNPEKCEVPNIPRTSHQFSQDWKKVRNSKELCSTYLKKIPISFFHGIEIDVELLIDIFSLLCEEYFGFEEAAIITESLTKTRGFSINMSFLDLKQKGEIIKLLEKIKKCEASKEISKHFKEILNK